MSHRRFISDIQPDDHHTILRVLRPLYPYQLNSNRDKWFRRLVQFHGKTVAAFKQSVRTDPPLEYPEAVAGWLRFFAEREGVLSFRLTRPTPKA